VVKKGRFTEIRVKTDTLNQVLMLMLLRRCRSLEDAKKRILAWLSELEEMYRSLLVEEDPIFNNIINSIDDQCKLRYIASGDPP